MLELVSTGEMPFIGHPLNAMESVKPLKAHPASPLSGEVLVPGDKSISHRALMLGGLAVGETRISGLLDSADVRATSRAMVALGAAVDWEKGDVCHVHGVGIGGCAEPNNVLDLENAGTAARLLMGITATQPITTHFTGDDSLRSRPMARVAEPLRRMGAQVISRRGCRLPLTIVGCDRPMPINYPLPVPSAQVKSAVLLAALNTPGETTVVESVPLRDHTERLLRHFGADVRLEIGQGPDRAITVVGQPELSGCSVAVPGDPSSAAFLIVVGLVVPGSSLTLLNVCVNETRSGLLTTLNEMGADIVVSNKRDVAGEPVADLHVRAGPLEAVDVPADRAPSMIDEYPVLAVAAACARGKTVMRGLGELRVKESDRFLAIARGLASCGVDVTEAGNDLLVGGHGGPPPGGGHINTRLDHRIAMAFLVFGMASQRPVLIDDAAPITTSFPQFVEHCVHLGAEID